MPFPFSLYKYSILEPLLTSVTPFQLYKDAIADIYHDDSKIKGEVVERLYKLGLREVITLLLLLIQCRETD